MYIHILSVKSAGQPQGVKIPVRWDGRHLDGMWHPALHSQLLPAQRRDSGPAGKCLACTNPCWKVAPAGLPRSRPQRLIVDNDMLI